MARPLIRAQQAAPLHYVCGSQFANYSIPLYPAQVSLSHEHPPEAGPLNHKPLGPWQSDEHRPREKRHLLLTLLLTSTTMVLEVIGGIISGSLSLLSDAGHMLTHSLALVISYAAIVIASRPAGAHRSFGLYRIEVLAALVNGLTMFAVAALIVYEAIDRLMHPVAIQSREMFIIAVIGLAVNLISALILSRVSHGDLNVRSAFMHMIGDTLSSVGVVGCAILIHFTGWAQSDPIVSFLIAAIISYWGFKLLHDSSHILLESTPKHINVDQVVKTICNEIPEIRQVHDVHIWEITSHMYTMTAHALTSDLRISETHDILDRLCQLVKERFNISHANIQFECDEKPET